MSTEIAFSIPQAFQLAQEERGFETLEFDISPLAQWGPASEAFPPPGE